MSGIPSTSEAYGVVGSRRAAPPGPRLAPWVTLVLLRRGPRSALAQVLGEAWDQGFADVLVAELSPPVYDAGALAAAYPGTRFLLPLGTVTPGQAVNWAASEVSSDRFLVLWDDQQIPDQGVSPRAGRLWADADRLALVPELHDPDGRPLPTVQVPGLEGGRLKILALGADEDTVDTLFPPDYSALYHRRRFLLTGGYDPSLTTPFWQKADWGLRANLWGERLTVEAGFRADYRRPAPVDDQTPDRSYPRFYLRNLAVRFSGDQGVLPWARLGPHLRRSGQGFSAALASFRENRSWVRTHRYRFRTDARLLAEQWGHR